MEDSSPYTKPHCSFSGINSPIRPNPIQQGRSYSDFLFKSLIFALSVIVLRLFPSQAPDFINQTILTKFWELLHLLFIGIAVAYGLFSRRNVEADIETHCNIDNTSNYVSKMFPVSTIFGDGYEIPCESDEKRMMYGWNSQYIEGESGVVCSNERTVMDEQYKPQLPNSEHNFCDSVRYDGTNVVQAWNSEYYQIEPVVVVAHPYYTIGECGEVVGYKPLGLPVRSLRSNAKDLDSPTYTTESDSSSGSRGSSSKSSDKSKDRKFGDLGPPNLEQKFNDAAGSASPIPWRSRSRRMGREEKHGNVTRPSHFRPLSVDETKFESLRSRSLQSTTSFSSHASLYSSVDSISSENVNFQEEEIGQKKASYMSSSENMEFQEEEMGQKIASYMSSSENMEFQEEEMGQKKISYMSSSETMEIQEEEMGPKKTSYMSSSENMNFQYEDLGKIMTSQGSNPRYGRMETREKYPIVSLPSHFSSISVDESQFESLRSRTFQSTGSLSSQASLYSSLDSLSSENRNLEKEDLRVKSSSHGSLSSSPSPPARRNGKVSLQAFHSRGYSSSSLLQDDVKKNLKDDLKSLNGATGKEPSGNRELRLHALRSDTEKPANLAKSPLKGKSVRTRRVSGLTSETMRTGEMCSKQTDEKVEKTLDNVEEVSVTKGKMRNGGPDPLLKGVSKQNLDTPNPKTETTVSNYQKRDKKESSKNMSNEDLDIELEKLQLSSDEDGVSECVHDSGLDSEVDKKASEFIAKFKAQIRLQKEASVERSRGLRTRGNYNR